MPFNVNKCHILQVTTKRQKLHYEMKSVRFKSVQCIQDPKFSQQCKDVADKANGMLGFINRNFFKNKDITLPMYINLVRPQREYAVQFWSPRYTNNIAKLEAAQRRTMKIIAMLRNKSYKERSPRLNLFSL